MSLPPLEWPADPDDVLIGSTFSGYGGLEMGAQLVLGGHAVWHCEYDAAPSAILAHHWPDVPNLGDITRVDWSTVPRVHVFTGGSPCQDVSTAGKRKGMKAGTRSGLWESMREGIAALRPPIVLWENVRGVTSAEATSDVELCAGCVGDESGIYLRALGRVLGDLVDLGYDAQWYGLRAADIGAPHGRFRIFVVAADAEHGGPVGLDAWLAARRAGTPGRPAVGSDRSPADTAGARREGITVAGASERRPHPTGRAGAPADADRRGLELEREGRAEQDRRAEAVDGRDDRGRAAADDARSAGRDAESHDLRATGLTGEQPRDRARAAAADAHGDDRGEQEPGAPEGVRARELLLGPAAPARARGGRRRGARKGYAVGPAADADRGAVPEPVAIVTAREAGIDFGVYAGSIQRWELILGREAPSPVERSAPSKKYPEGKWVLSPAFAEWMMGLPAGHLSDPAIMLEGKTGVRSLDRGSRLKAAGNGVVPQQAARALIVCLRRFVEVLLATTPSVVHGALATEDAARMASALRILRTAAEGAQQATQELADTTRALADHRTCKACDELKPLDAFAVNTHNGKRTHRGVCKACTKAGRRATR